MVGLKLEDVPKDFGWSLVMFGESDACLKSEKEKEPIRESSEVIGAKDEFSLPRDDLGELCCCIIIFSFDDNKSKCNIFI